jgi:hypothetical protein
LLFLQALALKNIEYEYEAINLVKDGGEQVGLESYTWWLQIVLFCCFVFIQFTQDHMKINAKGEIPVLFIDGHYLTQSVCLLLSTNIRLKPSSKYL